MRRLSNEEKLALMTEYMNKVGKKIVPGTIYKGYNLGAIKNNLRQAYYKGTLDMDENLLRSFIETGIITKEKERNRISDQEKYDFLLSMIEKTPEERKDEEDENGLSYDIIRRMLQIKYNKGELNLSKEQIEVLISNGILHRSPDEVKSLKNEHNRLLEYGIKLEEILDIEQRYGSFIAFVNQFKRGESECPFKKSVFRGFRVITLSSRDLTEEEKSNYAEFVLNLFYLNEESIMYKSGLYIDVDRVDQIIETLEEPDKEFLKMSYGIGCKRHTTAEMSEKYGLKYSTVIYKRKVVQKALIKKYSKELRYEILKDAAQELSYAQEDYQEMASKIKNIGKMKELITDEDGSEKAYLDFEQLKKLGISLYDFKEFFKVEVDDDGMIMNKALEYKEKQDEWDKEFMTVEELKLSSRAQNCLERKRN